MPQGPDLPDVVLAWLPEEPQFEAAPPGETSFVQFVSGRESERVVKCSQGPVYDDLLAREYEVLRALADTDLPVPRAFGLHREDGVAWLVTERMPGEPLWIRRRDQPDHPEHLSWMQQTGRLLAQIHCTPLPPAFPSGSATPWREPDRRRRKRAIADSRLEDVLSEALTRDDDEEPVRTLVHGDFTLDNVLVDQQISAVIDWGAAGPGDPAFDIALALSTAPHIQLTADEIASFLQGYREGPLSPELARYVEALPR